MREDQRSLAEGLRRRFGPTSVMPEWRALATEPGLYSPRVDIAVGPFATDRRFVREYDDLAHRHRALLVELHSVFAGNVRTADVNDLVSGIDDVCGSNQNARCFLAIEVEGSGSRKHTMGGAINAAALGRVGISVACSPSELNKLLKMRRYLRFLADVGKNTFNTTNLLVVTREQLASALGTDIPTA